MTKFLTYLRGWFRGFIHPFVATALGTVGGELIAHLLHLVG